MPWPFRARETVLAVLLRHMVVFATAVVVVPVLPAQQPARQDSTGTDSTRRGSPNRLMRWLRLDHFGVALGPSLNVTRPGWTTSAQLRGGLAGGFFRGEGIGRRSRAGVIPALKFDIFAKRLSVVDTSGGGADALATIRTRSLMAGLGWSQPVRQSVYVVVTGVVGATFNTLRGATAPSRGAPLDVASAPSSIRNSLGWETSGRVWHRLSPGTVIITGISYYRTRPRLAFADGSEGQSNFDTLRADLGVAFTLYRR